jgi:hypothetical protein
MMIKIEINFKFDWRVKLKRKINLAKRKKIKRMMIKINIKIKKNYDWRLKLKRIIIFPEKAKKKKQQSKQQWLN